MDSSKESNSTLAFFVFLGLDTGIFQKKWIDKKHILRDREKDRQTDGQMNR